MINKKEFFKMTLVNVFSFHTREEETELAKTLIDMGYMRKLTDMEKEEYMNTHMAMASFTVINLIDSHTFEVVKNSELQLYHLGLGDYPSDGTRIL